MACIDGRYIVSSRECCASLQIQIEYPIGVRNIALAATEISVGNL